MTLQIWAELKLLDLGVLAIDITDSSPGGALGHGTDG